MKKYIVEHEFDGYEIGTYLKETKGYSSRGLRNLEIYLNGKRIKNNAKPQEGFLWLFKFF